TKSGAKLLDFGLAKRPTEGQSPIGGQTHLPTEAKPLTTEGTILGTFQYMAPEQLEGLEADARTDIFALGCVLYEMATGRRAFQGASKTSLIAAIVSSQPEPISSFVAMAPPALDHVVRKCLEKDADDRWQSAHDVASELRWISEVGSPAAVAAPLAKRKQFSGWIGWLVAAVIAGAWTVAALSRKTAAPPRVETAIVAPDGALLDSEGGGIALSPDGRRLAFVAHRTGEPRLVWIRDLGSSSVRALAGTAGASLPFWSPDGKAIAFFAAGRLLRVSLDGGSPELVADDAVGTGGAWAPDGSILYASGTMGRELFRVPASGGAAAKLVEMPNRFPRNPVLLPDGRRFLFTSAAASEPDALYVGSLDGGEPRLVLPGVYSNAAYASPGLILYVRDGALRAQPVDPKTLAPQGDPIRIADSVRYVPDDQMALFTVSADGSLAYVVGEAAGRTELAWVSRDGKSLDVVGSAAMYYSPRLSHDERRIAVDLSEAQTAEGDIWIFDLQRDASTRLTHDPANESSPIWSPDGRSVIFFSEKKGSRNIYERSAGGIGGDVAVLEDERRKAPIDLSPDGRWLAFTIADAAEVNYDIWLLDRQSGQARAFLASPFSESALQFSPDGKWLAYVSNESGQNEVYVMQFPESSGKWVVSRGGGEQPAWSADGRQVYYLTKEQKLMSVPVTLGASFDAGPQVALFDMPVRARYKMRQYCVSKDGSRFLLNRRVDDDATRPITFVQNWTASPTQ
ncbi:MAG TPA: protein kinase, partial [Longimicrobiaceae bacterium]|nr:protein kinase [Longimicrobiaceae bacterium]